MGFLVNEGDKLTAELKKQKQIEAQKEYGLSPEQLAEIKLPPTLQVKVYNIEKIVNARSKISTIEKIDLLLDLERALLKKLKVNAEARAAKNAELKTDTDKPFFKEEIFRPKVSSNIDEDLIEPLDSETLISMEQSSKIE